MSPERSTRFLLPAAMEGWLCPSKSQVTFTGKWQNTLENTHKMPRAGNYRGLPRTRVGGHFIAEEERVTVDTTAVIPLTS